MILLSFVLIIGSLAKASPMPATATSALVAPEKGIFYAARGFLLTAPSSWSLEKADEKTLDIDAESRPEFAVVYSNPSYPTAHLSVQTDSLRTETTLEAYAKKWMKDYSSYGFDVLGAKTFSNQRAKGLVVDLVHKRQGTQIRQVIFLKQKTAVTLTCLDQVKVFSRSIEGCNQIVKTFSWR